MFESRPATPPPSTAATIVPAGVLGYGLLFFPNNPPGKMNIDVVKEIVQQNLLPVIAWQLKDDRLVPLSIAARQARSSSTLRSL